MHKLAKVVPVLTAALLMASVSWAGANGIIIDGIINQPGGGPVSAPEIDGATGMAALTLIAGAVLIIRSRRKK